MQRYTQQSCPQGTGFYFQGSLLRDSIMWVLGDLRSPLSGKSPMRRRRRSLSMKKCFYRRQRAPYSWRSFRSLRFSWRKKSPITWQKNWKLLLQASTLSIQGLHPVTRIWSFRVICRSNLCWAGSRSLPINRNSTR